MKRSWILVLLFALVLLVGIALIARLSHCSSQEYQLDKYKRVSEARTSAGVISGSAILAFSDYYSCLLVLEAEPGRPEKRDYYLLSEAAEARDPEECSRGPDIGHLLPWVVSPTGGKVAWLSQQGDVASLNVGVLATGSSAAAQPCLDQAGKRPSFKGTPGLFRFVTEERLVLGYSRENFASDRAVLWDCESRIQEAWFKLIKDFQFLELIGCVGEDYRTCKAVSVDREGKVQISEASSDAGPPVAQALPRYDTPPEGSVGALQATAVAVNGKGLVAVASNRGIFGLVDSQGKALGGPRRVAGRDVSVRHAVWFTDELLALASEFDLFLVVVRQLEKGGWEIVAPNHISLDFGAERVGWVTSRANRVAYGTSNSVIRAEFGAVCRSSPNSLSWISSWIALLAFLFAASTFLIHQSRRR